MKLHDLKETDEKVEKVLTEKPWIPFTSVDCVQNISTVPRKSQKNNNLFICIKSDSIDWTV